MKQTFNHDILQGRLPTPAGTPGMGMAQTPPSTAELAQRLQTTLELERVIDLFSQAIQWTFPHDGLAYDHPDLGLHITRGRLSRHSCADNLVVEHDSIGELRFLRGRKFQESELQALEKLLTALVYPLRNSLLYHKAIAAAQTDPLTGLQNRAALAQLLPRELATLRRNDTPLALLVVDVDHFKQINDTLGHSAGDRVLKAVARCLRQASREEDMVFRFGGEEFVLLIHTADGDHSRQAGERIRNVLKHCPELQASAPGFQLTVSIGVATASADDDAHSLFDRADKAMYAAKQSGRDQVVLATA